MALHNALPCIEVRLLASERNIGRHGPGAGAPQALLLLLLLLLLLDWKVGRKLFGNCGGSNRCSWCEATARTCTAGLDGRQIYDPRVSCLQDQQYRCCG
jgi:hypothetical protein